jgi:4-amino-4-deoxy-L-arabinose transferase-like glycosyltransferase
MNFSLQTRQPGPLPWLVLVICAVFLLAGIVGHDPWKTDDAVGLAIAHDFYTGAQWLKPTLAGEVWAEAEPLWHWTAAALATVTSFLLPFHDGARLATALFGGLFLYFVAGAARRFYGEDAGWGAPLLAIGTLGLLMPLHEAQPASAILAATAGVYFGVALTAERPLIGAVVTGTSLGASFLAGGLVGVLPPLTLLALPLFRKQYLAPLVALALAILIAGTWPLLLAQREPAHFNAWWTAELATIGFQNGFSLGHAKFLGWFAWPILYVAPWAIWRSRHQLTSPGIAIPLAGFIIAFIWFISHEADMNHVLALIPPLTLLAASGSAKLRRGAANAWDWFGMMTLTITAAFVWLAYCAFMTGWPPKLATKAARLVPGFTSDFAFVAFAVALLATVAWSLTLVRLPRSPWRVVTRWAAGITVTWVLLMALLLPMIDYAKSYRPVVDSLRRSLPADAGCIGRLSLSATHRAALDYFGGIRTRWGSKTCNWLIVQGGTNELAPEGWAKVWEGYRPGDRNERLRLYRRSGA